MDFPRKAIEQMSSLDQVEDLLRAFAARDLTAIKALADAGLDLDTIGGGGLTTLMRAVFRGDAVAVEWILAAGADPDARGVDGMRALDFARMLERRELVELLIAAGASTEAASGAGPDKVEGTPPPATPRPAANRATGTALAYDVLPDDVGDQIDDRFDDHLL